MFLEGQSFFPLHGTELFHLAKLSWFSALFRLLAALSSKIHVGEGLIRIVIIIPGIRPALAFTSVSTHYLIRSEEAGAARGI